MRAIQIDRLGGPEVLHLAEVPVGEPGPHEVRVRHHAIGVNFIDTYFRSGLYAAKLPVIPGNEGAGVIEAVGGSVTHLAIGDRVTYYANGPGSYAEARVVDAKLVVRLPDTVTFEQAAAITLKGLTVQYLLRRTRVTLAPGDPIVWHAAAGGVGLIACQWAKALGLRLIATAGSDAKCQLALAHGAAHAINYRTDDVVKRVRELTNGRGVDVVYDSVGKDTFERSLDCLAPFGLLVCFGNASGPVPPLDVLTLSRKGSLYVTRPTLGTHLATRSAVESMSADLFGLVTQGAIRVEIGNRYKLEDAARAHRELEARATTGSSILVP